MRNVLCVLRGTIPNECAQLLCVIDGEMGGVSKTLRPLSFCIFMWSRVDMIYNVDIMNRSHWVALKNNNNVKGLEAKRKKTRHSHTSPPSLLNLFNSKHAVASIFIRNFCNQKTECSAIWYEIQEKQQRRSSSWVRWTCCRVECKVHTNTLQTHFRTIRHNVFACVAALPKT